MTGGGMPDMQQLLMQAQKMQQDIMAAQEELARAQVQGTSGGGLVTATVTGGGELIALTIAPEAIDPDDAETLADLVLAAVRDANRAVGELQAQMMNPFAEGMGMGGFEDFFGGATPGGVGPGGPGAIGGSQFGLPPGT